MDPYLESPDEWSGFHQWMVPAIAASLNHGLPAGFVATLDQYIWLIEEPEDPTRDPLAASTAAKKSPGRKRGGKPDTLVLPSRADRDGGVGVLERVSAARASIPTLQTRLPKATTQRRSVVKITSAQGSDVLCVVELLSPSNKKLGYDYEAYLAKRNGYLAAGVNLVEIDLLRAGSRMPMGSPHPPATDYYAVICPVDQPGTASVWAFSVREMLPVLPVPFKTGLPPVTLDVRACLDRAYDDGRYRDKLDYGRPCDPPLRREDAEWAATRL
jgi:hypothetical protein